jgi:hypothetical protein
MAARGKSFFFWAFILLLGAVGLTMDVHYHPSPHEPKAWDVKLDGVAEEFS